MKAVKTSSLMRWHHDKRKKDGTMRHPADSLARKSFDELHQGLLLTLVMLDLTLLVMVFQPLQILELHIAIGPLF